MEKSSEEMYRTTGLNVNRYRRERTNVQKVIALGEQVCYNQTDSRMLIYGNEYNIVRKNFNLEFIVNS